MLILKNKIALLALGMLMFFSIAALSQGLDFITINSSFDDKKTDKNNTVLSLTISIEDGFIYEENFKIGLNETSKFNIDKIEYPKSKTVFDKFKGQNSQVYEGKAKFKIHFDSQISSKDHAELKNSISISYKACSQTTSYKTRTITLGESSLVSKELNTGLSKKKRNLDLDNYLDKGLFIILIAAFITGLISSLTPCVYPIIPIVVSVIGSQTGSDKFKGFKLSVVFAFGLSILYSVLGIVAAKSGKVFGNVFQSSYIVLLVSLVFALMGLSLLGLFEIKIPVFISKRLSGKDSKANGYTGTFLAGAITGIVAVPCIGPFVISVITFSAKQASIAKGFFIMFSFSLGLSFLFVLIGTFSSILASIPKPGSWMIILKKVFGLLLFCVFLYYVNKIFSYSTFIIILGLTLFFLAWIFTRLDNFSNDKIRIFHKRLSQFTAVGGTVVLLGLAFSGNIPVNSEKGMAKHKGDIPWITSEKNALEISNTDKKPLLIDFYADWCEGCRQLANETFPDKRITDKKNDFIFLMVDMTKNSVEGNRLSKKYSVYGLPTIVFLDTSGNVMKDYTIEGFIPAGILAEIMDRVIDSNK